MLQRKFILALSSRLGQYRYLSTQDFISQNDAEFTTKTSIPHTPIFSRSLMEFFRQRQEGPDKHFKILDMTFGSGGHTCYILDQFKRYGVQGFITVYASDCDTESYNLARRLMSERNYDVKELVPIRSSFKNLEEKLIEKGVEPGTLSGILIDTGISTIQWANQQRGFCHLRDGTLDLRLDPFQNTPKGYEVLQNIEEDALLKLLRRYGSLKTNAKHIATAILEARFMQYEFKTVHELTEIMESAVKHATKTPHSDIADPEMVSEFVQKTITALRIFVNDELNQLDYAIRYLAAKYLKETGILAVIAHNEVEKRVVHRCLKQISLDDIEDTNEVLSTQVKLPSLCRIISYIDPSNLINIDKDNCNGQMLSYKEIEHIQHQNPWKIIQGEPPLPLPMAEQILYPRFKNAVLFAAQRVA